MYSYRLIICILFLQHVLPSTSKKELEHEYKCKNCDHLSNFEFEVLCSGSVTNDIVIKFKDKHVRQGTPFIMFATLTYPLHLVLVLDFNDNLKCTLASFDAECNFGCASKAERSTVHLSFYQLYCFNRSLAYTREYGTACQPKVAAGYYRKNAHTVIVYTRYYKNAADAKAPKYVNMIGIPLIMSFLSIHSLHLN